MFSSVVSSIRKQPLWQNVPSRDFEFDKESHNLHWETKGHLELVAGGTASSIIQLASDFHTLND
jgi:hypothetical protein